MSELRWNPILREWVITATERQNRTFKPPADYCPLCPSKDGSVTEVAEDYDLVVFENRFPSLKYNPPLPKVEGSEFYPVRKARGICEVVLFTSKHSGVMSEEPLSRYLKLVKVWKDRYHELGRLDQIDYVYIFENKGEEVGVTLEHPHGQIYAYPFIPPLVQKGLESSKDYLNKTGSCLFCMVVNEEMGDGRRLIAENGTFAAFIPFFAKYTYEVHIYAKKHLPSFAEFTIREEKDLAAILKTVTMKYDNLFGFVFPYIMAIHQQPTNGTAKDYSHFRIEFYPPKRTKDKLKYLAGSELGAGVYINNALAEEKAKELREVEPREGVHFDNG